MKLKELPKGVATFSFIEIAIGIITIATLSSSVVFGLNTKPLNVLAFVYITSLLSLLLGIGLLYRNRQAYELLLFLAGVVILTKILMFSKIIHLNGALETIIPSTFKNSISIIYHGVLWLYLRQKGIKALYGK